MKHLFPVVALFELKRFFRKRNIIVFLLMLALSLYLGHEGIVDYKNAAEKISDFQKSEAMMFSKILNYNHYSHNIFPEFRDNV
jgi:hypothetical protein